MPPHRWGNNNKRKPPPPGYEVVEPILEALENELRDKVKETNDGKRKVEALWPVHQINWQRSRYIYDMYYTFQRINKPVFDYCVRQKIVDSALMAKLTKPGYKRLRCLTFVINAPTISLALPACVMSHVRIDPKNKRNTGPSNWLPRMCLWERGGATKHFR